MLRKNLQKRLERDKVPAEIIESGFLAYDYLNDPKRCVGGSAYSWEIADVVFGQPTMAWSTSREKMGVSLSLLEARAVVEQRQADLRYIIKNKLE